MAGREIRPLGPSVSYLPSGTNVGLWDGPEGSVLIDSGNDADTGRVVLKAVESSGRRVAAVLVTHSNADHMGGAAFIASRSGASVYASRIEAAFCADPLLEPYAVWGACPPPELRNKFFVAPPVRASALEDGAPLPAALAGARVVPLPGHFFAQRGFLAGGVLFAADALFGEAFVAKHPVFFAHDVAAFLSSLDLIAGLGADIVVPSHGEPVRDGAALAALNRAAVERVASRVADACAASASFEDVLSSVCAAFGIELDWAQYALVGSTVRSYLVWLRGCGVLEAEFGGGRMLWRRS